MKISNVFKMVKPFVVKHQPEILVGMGITGMIFSAVWSVKATIQAKNKVDILSKDAKLTKKEIVKETWKYYIPVLISLGISIPCIITSNRVLNNRNVALAAAYTLSETALQEYQDKTKDIVGDKKYEKIQESISNDIIQKTHSDGIGNVTLIGDGDTLFYEPLSGRYFKSNWNRISKSANELNALAMGDVSGVIMLGEWYHILGLDRTALDNILGWTIADGKDGIIDIKIDSVLTPDNIPCGAIRYNTIPKKI